MSLLLVIAVAAGVLAVARINAPAGLILGITVVAWFVSISSLLLPRRLESRLLAVFVAAIVAVVMIFLGVLVWLLSRWLAD
jgi:hypothetical protein